MRSDIDFGYDFSRIFLFCGLLITFYAIAECICASIWGWFDTREKNMYKSGTHSRLWAAAIIEVPLIMLMMWLLHIIWPNFEELSNGFLRFAADEYVGVKGIVEEMPSENRLIITNSDTGESEEYHFELPGITRDLKPGTKVWIKMIPGSEFFNYLDMVNYNSTRLRDMGLTRRWCLIIIVAFILWIIFYMRGILTDRHKESEWHVFVYKDVYASLILALCIAGMPMCTMLIGAICGYYNNSLEILWRISYKCVLIIIFAMAVFNNQCLIMEGNIVKYNNFKKHWVCRLGDITSVRVEDGKIIMICPHGEFVVRYNMNENFYEYIRGVIEGRTSQTAQ